MRVIIANDLFEVRWGLRIAMAMETGIHIAGEAEDIGGLLTQARNVNPDLLLVDWNLSGLKMEKMVPILRAACPNVKVIAMSSRPEEQKNALEAGADAFVEIGSQPEKMLEMVRIMKKKMWKSVS